VLHSGPLANGYKASVLEHLTPGHVRQLERYFKKWSGVGVGLGCEA
jgi:hypothetical protein